MSKIVAVIVNYHANEQTSNLKKTLQKAIPDVVVIDNNKINRGFAKGVNLGIKQALTQKADSVILINPDVEISPSQILQLEKTSSDIVGPVLSFERGSKKVYDFGGKVNWVFGRTTHLEFDSNITFTRRRLVKVKSVDYVSGACMLIRSKVFEKIGLFDEKYFLYFEDVDFCLRAKRAGFSLKVNPKVIIKHQISEHRSHPDKLKGKFLLNANRHFIFKWVPWSFKPLAYLYWFLLFLRYRQN